MVLSTWSSAISVGWGGYESLGHVVCLAGVSGCGQTLKILTASDAGLTSLLPDPQEVKRHRHTLLLPWVEPLHGHAFFATEDVSCEPLNQSIHPLLNSFCQHFVIVKKKLILEVL